MTLVSISITGPSPDWLAEHTRRLVEQRLVACGNIVPSVRSIYRWEDAVEDDVEAYVVLHTRSENVQAVIDRTNADHPYDTVQILATVVHAADPDYEQWVLASTDAAGP